MALMVQLMCPFGYDNTFSSTVCVPIILGTGIFASIGVSFLVRGSRKVENLSPNSIGNQLVNNLLRRHVLAVKIFTGISILGLSGFNIAMQFPKNEILIGICLAVGGGAGLASVPLLNELTVETTFPAGEATSTGIGTWLLSPVSGALVALSSLIPYVESDDYSYSVCRDGETQDLSWFLSIMNGILIVYYLFFVYFYRKFNQLWFTFNSLHFAYRRPLKHGKLRFDAFAKSIR